MSGYAAFSTADVNLYTHVVIRDHGLKTQKMIAWCRNKPDAQLIADALNARESLARALGVKLDAI